MFQLNPHSNALMLAAVFGAGLVSIEPAGAAQTCSYQLMTTIVTGARTATVAAVDLNKDKILDIVATNQADATISVALGQGGGKFAPAKSYATTVGPYDTTVADFNGDGYPDIASANFGAAAGEPYGTTVSVRLNKGDGTFGDKADYAVTEATNVKVRAITSGDFNGDGKMDIAAAVQGSGVAILLGNGNGTFKPFVLYPAGGGEHGIVAADFNKDGHPDLAVANNSPNGGMNVLLGKGDGTFSKSIGYVAGAGTFGLATGDLNGDGYPDIVTANDRAGSISVFINLGAKQPGRFADKIDYPTTRKAVAVSLGDLNRDGKLDVLSSANAGAVTDVYLNNGDGTFQVGTPIETGNGSYGSAVADFDGDGIADVAGALVDGRAVIFKGSCSPSAPDTVQSGIAP